MTSGGCEETGVGDLSELAADLVAFDPDTVDARATYADPLHYSAGIPHVAVNGQLVVDNGKVTEARPGRPLRGSGYTGSK